MGGRRLALLTTFLLLALASLLSACPKVEVEPATEVLVTVHSDLELERVEAEVLDVSGQESTTKHVFRGIEPPFSFGVHQPPGGAEWFRVVARGYRGGKVVEQKRSARFETGHAGQLDVWLNRVCLANFCDDDPDLTCFSESLATARVAAGECGPVPSGMGSTWAEGDSGAPPEDAEVDTGATSLDATSTDDAAHDAPNDTPADGEVLPPGDSGPDAREPDAALDASPDSSDSGPCDSRTECDRGFNCHGHRCLATPGNCAALKRDYPDLPDGVYWLKPNANSLLLAYCDMSRAVDLCNEQPADHRSVTRDGSSLPFVLTSVLDLPAKECLIWAVHNAVDNLPFSALVSAAGASLDTCQALGFRGDAMIEYCEYGATKGSCGFAVEQSNYDWYGNQCFGCTLNEGSFASYRRQGPIQIGAIISSVDGTTKTRCRVE